MVIKRRNMRKLIVILGATATGKTALAIKLCQIFNGEVISADSRQIYKYMPIGTGQPSGIWKTEQNRETYLVDDIPYHLIDCLEPDEEFSLADFKKQAVRIIQNVHKSQKIPFLVGGTGLYISALVDNFDIPKIKPNKKLRREIENKSLTEMVELLKKEDPVSAQSIDLLNPRRVVRALEVVLSTGQSFAKQQKRAKPLFDVLQVGLQRPREEIYYRVNQRVDQMIENGLMEEVKKLLAKGYNWDLPAMSGLGYRQFRDYLAGEQTLAEAVEILKRDTRRYVKRQLTWFKRDKSIAWIKADDIHQCEQLIKNFILT